MSDSWSSSSWKEFWNTSVFASGAQNQDVNYYLPDGNKWKWCLFWTEPPVLNWTMWIYLEIKVPPAIEERKWVFPLSPSDIHVPRAHKSNQAKK